MKEPKDIFDLFRENEDKLNRPPSKRAWERLENRLDNHRSQQEHRISRRPSPWRNVLSMAGVLLVLVTMISAIGLIMKNHSVAKTAINESAPSPMFVLEEIGVYSDQIKNPHNIGLYEKQLKRLNTNPFLEGDPSKELRVQRNVYADKKSKYINGNPLADNNITPAIASSSSFKDQTKSISGDLDTESNKSVSATVGEFSWLIGEWTSKASSEVTHSKEIWKMKNDALSGKAFLTLNGKEELVESMKIEELNGTLHFTLSILQENRSRKYKLKSINDSEIVFENIQLPFPNQIILRPNNAKDQFIGILKHRSEIEPRDVSETLLSPRHKIEEDQVKRVMLRI